MSAEVRVRYAPSPTGHLHIGGARTALFDYLFARKHQGKFIVRFEDTDQTRHVESGVQNQLDGLKWLGLEWDESVDVGGPYAPYRQMERLHLYQPFIDQLINQGDAYYCCCSEAELEQERAEQEARGENPMYSGKCRSLSPQAAERYKAEGRMPSLRFRVPRDEVIAFEDRIRGHMVFEANGIGDFIIVRPDGIPTYNFAVVLDDYLMHISHVVRGEEHLTNTPKQILIYRALRASIPEFAHLSLILNQDRKKMSKRDESILQFVQQYRELGYLPEAVLNFIALLGWSPGGEEEIFSKEELIEQFDLDRISKSPAVFDMDKLNWMNNHYIKKTDTSRIVALALPHLQKAGYLPQALDDSGYQWAAALIGLYQEQLRYAGEIVDLAELFFREHLEYDAEAKAILAEEHVPVVLGSLKRQMELATTYDPDGLKTTLKNVQQETGYKGKQLFMTVRAALTGQTHGPDLYQTVFLLGKDKVRERLEKLLS